jgi:hypothetical protein
LIVQGSFAWYLRSECIMLVIKLSPSPVSLTHSLSPWSPNIQQFTVQCIILYSGTHSFKRIQVPLKGHMVSLEESMNLWFK